MPYPPHYLLSYGGDFISDPGEVWSNNMRFAKDDNLDGASLPDYSSSEYTSKLDGLVTAVTAHMAHTDSAYSSNVRLKYVKLNKIGADGLYSDKSNSHTRFIAGAGTAGGGTPTGPISNALCITFLTDVERGPGSRGRMFVPHPDVNVAGPTFRISNTNATSIMTAWGQYVQALNSVFAPGVPGEGPKASVLSKIGTGSARNIRRTQVGDVLDYMGSRRNRLVEARVTSGALSGV